MGVPVEQCSSALIGAFWGVMSCMLFQALVFLRKDNGGTVECFLLRRADMGVWQGVADGGEVGRVERLPARK